MTRPKLLLADDSVTIRKVVEMTFADEGIDVTAAANGEEAMEKFVESQPDIVLADVNMPDPTGYHICEMIKQDDLTKHIPVILLVGSFEPFDNDEAERVGADGVLTKPFQSIRTLVANVEELLGIQSAPAQSPAETADIDNLYDQSFSRTTEAAGEQSAEMLLSDPGMDDEMIETEHPASNGNAPVMVAPPPDLKNEIDEPDRRAEVGHDVPVAAEVQVAATDFGNEPSEQLIALVARRVIEKLSDKVVREIAQEAVPRIAETLMREALEPNTEK